MPETKRGHYGTWVRVAGGREVYVADEQPEIPKRTLKGSYTMSKADRDKVHAQTGQHFDDHAQYKAWCKANGKRDIEKGEVLDQSWRIFSDWTRGGQKGECPLPATPPTKEKVGQLSELMEKMRGSGELAQRAERLGLGRDLDRMVRLRPPGE